MLTFIQVHFQVPVMKKKNIYFFTLLKLRFYANKIKVYLFLEIHIFIHPLILL